MTIALPFDTETTGLFSPKLDLNHPSQPHLVSFSGLQVNLDTGIIQQSASKVVIPDGWKWSMDSEAARVHGLSPEFCAQHGRSEKEVLDEILHLWNNEAHLVAHNLRFDRNIVSVAIARYYPGQTGLLSAWQEFPGTCTALGNKERVGARTATGRRKAMPNLLETYQHFFPGESIDKQHSANADAVAVYQIFIAMEADY